MRALRLCLVTNLKNQSFSSYRPFLLKAIQGGITSVQLREKTNNLVEFKKLALQFKSTLRPFNIPLIINDHVEMANEIDAEGIHLGQSDLSPEEARKIVGLKKIIGWSIESMKELEIANQLTCIDYVAASAVFPSKTKTDCKTIWGINGLWQIAQQSRHPVMAIGGITLDNIGAVIDNGACGAAVVSAIHDHDDPRQAAENLMTEIDNCIQRRSSPCLRK